jgi:hypothetical protein
MSASWRRIRISSTDPAFCLRMFQDLLLEKLVSCHYYTLMKARLQTWFKKAELNATPQQIGEFDLGVLRTSIFRQFQSMSSPQELSRKG